MKKQPEIQRIEDVEGLPVLRRLYEVPVAVLKRKFLCSKEPDKIVLVPIIGEPHTDKEFANFEHYHVDGRFATVNEAIQFINKGKTNAAIATQPTSSWSWELVRIERKPMKCRHKTGGLNFDQMKGMAMPIFRAFYSRYLGKKCKGNRCPHWGQPMQEQPDGLMQCPLHGLHAENGVIVFPDKLKFMIGDL